MNTESPRSEHGSLILKGCRIVDCREGVLRDPSDVWIDGGKIREIGRVRNPPVYVDVVKLQGKVIMPGLIDCHVHCIAASTDLGDVGRSARSLLHSYASYSLKRMLLRGFTSVRDAGGADGGLAEGVRRGYLAGPRLFPSGLALAQTGGQGDSRSLREREMHCRTHSIARIVDGEDEARRAVREELSAGATQIKVMASGGLASGTPLERSHFSVGELSTIVDEARLGGTYVAAHAYGPESIERAIDVGVRTIEHGNLITSSVADKMQGLGTYVVPTLAIYHGMQADYKKLGIDGAAPRRASEALQSALRCIDICRTAGVKIGFGTDLEGSLESYQSTEFELRRDVQSAAELLASATVIGAEVIGMAGELGEIREGAYADLVVLRSDPLKDLGILYSPGQPLPCVMKAGRFVAESSELGDSWIRRNLG